MSELWKSRVYYLGEYGDDIKYDISIDKATLQVGELRLYQKSDIIFHLLYEDRKWSIGFDIDDIFEINMNERNIIIKKDFCDDVHYIVHVIIYEELIQLKDMIKWCKYLSSLTMSIDERMRDFYFAGVYSAMETREDWEKLRNNIGAFMPPPQTFDILDMLAGRYGLDETARDKILSTKCTFCTMAKRNTPTIDYFIHPYVPSNYEGEPLAMCYKCLDAWQIYRDLAAQNKELILEGEENEEICGICSDTPKEIVMCSSCVRSFCNTCLKLIMSEQDMMDMQHNEHWKCMICAQGIQHSNPEPRSNWSKIEVENAAFNPYHFARDIVQGRVPPPQPFQHQFPPLYKAPSARKPAKFQLPYISAFEGNNDSKDDSTLLSASSAPTKKKSSRKEKPLQSEVVQDIDTRSVFPPSEVPSTGELYYFSQYVKLRDSASNALNNNNNTRKLKKVVVTAQEELSEDFCYLCKDGGDLVECEYQCDAIRCLKVYHEDCLNFQVSHLKKKWTCPRHFCASCGKTDIRYACLYCPLSICRTCSEGMPTHFYKPRYIISPQSNDVAIISSSSINRDINMIICQSCIELGERCVTVGMLKPSFLKGALKYFPKCKDDPTTLVPIIEPTNSKKGTKLPVDEKEKSPKPIRVTKVIQCDDLRAAQNSPNFPGHGRKRQREHRSAVTIVEEWTPEEENLVRSSLIKTFLQVKYSFDVYRISQTNFDDLLLKPGHGILLSKTLEMFRNKAAEILTAAETSNPLH